MITQKVVKWHEDRNLIDGTTDQKQVVKLLEEFIEVYDSCFDFENEDELMLSLLGHIEDLSDEGRIKCRKNKQEEKKDGIGDMCVVQINMARRNGWTLYECIEQAYDEIKDRKGKMINGTFVKESDL